MNAMFEIDIKVGHVSEKLFHLLKSVWMSPYSQCADGTLNSLERVWYS